MAETFDYVVVGAGSAGCVMAARLSEDPKVSVLLLEAGGPASKYHLKMPVGFLKAVMDPAVNWGYWSEPEPHMDNRPLPLPRGKVMGGSGSINGMFYMRGHPLDFDQWAQMGASGWSYADVLPYFRKMESSWRGEDPYHGASGPVRVSPIDAHHALHDALMQAAEGAGFTTSRDLSGANPEGFARGECTIDERGRRVSSATAYLRPALSRPNLEVRDETLVHRVVIEDGRAVGVEFERGGQRHIVRCGREVIVCGGTYNSPHLLMLSGIGPAEHLREMGVEVVADSPGVGTNLSEHPTASMEFKATRPVTFLKELRADKVALSAMRWALLGSGPLANQLNSCNVVIRTREGLERPDVQIMANPIRFDAKIWFPGFTPRQDHLFWAGIVDLHPRSRGWVKLKSADPRELPSVTLNLLSDPEDLATLRAGMRAARRIYHTPPQAALTGVEVTPGEQLQTDDELDAYLRASTYICMHPVGTCAMGTSPLAVVDPELRVKGVQGLRVVDASVMPTVPGANTNAPTMMIAERAADLIKGWVLERAEV